MMFKKNIRRMINNLQSLKKKRIDNSLFILMDSIINNKHILNKDYLKIWLIEMHIETKIIVSIKINKIKIKAISTKILINI